MLSVEIEKRLGDFVLHAAFETAGGATALFGPSGAGKTSLANAIAGLLKPDRGHIRLAGDTLFDSDTGIDVPAWRRRVGYVFQEGRLFPHLSVKNNLTYGRWMNGLTVDAKAFARVIDLLDLGRLLNRRPGNLSGGERQRVAVGRALLMQPRLLLLDEPLASLDAARKAEILPYLERLRDEAQVPIVYVSHNLVEVRRMATQVVVMEQGRIVNQGGLELLAGQTESRGGTTFHDAECR